MEFVVAIPVVLIMALLCLQLALMYRAKLAHNFAVQEAVRIGAMSNGRVVPRFLTDKISGMVGNVAIGIPGKVAFSTIVDLLKTSDGPAVDSAAGSSSEGDEEAANLPNGLNSQLSQNIRTLKTPPTSAFVIFLKGLLRYGDSSVLQGYINGITPMYVNGASGPGQKWRAQFDAYLDALPNSCILYHNPTQAAFLESGNIELQGIDYGILKIPADYMRFRTPLGTAAADTYDIDTDSGLKGRWTGKTIQENTVLSIEILWSYPLKVPIANSVIIGLTRLFDSGDSPSSMVADFRSKALDRGRYPFSAAASYRAQNALHWQPFYPLGPPTPPVNDDGFQVIDLVRKMWNEIVGSTTYDPTEPQIGFCLGQYNLDGLAPKNQVSDHWWGESLDRSAASAAPASLSSSP
ncbi:TadE family protein [Collimonas arenae]|uniref:TadE family protein n=1 Tax=Collimonas arenae TaxID=279058 RepID=UPI0009ED155A|nr:TadE family protein [Collimonas arenae]